MSWKKKKKTDWGSAQQCLVVMACFESVAYFSTVEVSTLCVRAVASIILVVRDREQEQELPVHFGERAKLPDESV